MAVIRLNTAQITDQQSFHAACKELMGFPEFYGMNWDAWIDCLTYLNDEGDGLSKFQLKPNEYLFIYITDTESFRSRLPEVVASLIDCTAFVNRRHEEAGIPNRIALVFLDALVR